MAVYYVNFKINGIEFRGKKISSASQALEIFNCLGQKINGEFYIVEKKGKYSKKISYQDLEKKAQLPP